MKKFIPVVVKNGDYSSTCKNIYSFIIVKFVGKLYSPKDYARETKIAKKLVKITDDVNFWKAIPQIKVSSLCYFINQFNYNLLISRYNEYLDKKWENFLNTQKDIDFEPEKHIIEEEKIGEDFNVEKKPLSLKDFLNS